MTTYLQIGLKSFCVGPQGEPQGTPKELEHTASPTTHYSSEMLSCSGILENIWSTLICNTCSSGIAPN